MTYLPSEYININYKYKLNNDYFIIITNNNCYTQYSNIYCDCYNIFPRLDYQVSEKSSCNTTNITNFVDSSHFTDNFYYRIDFTNILIMFSIMAFFILFIPLKLVSKIFRKGVL